MNPLTWQREHQVALLLGTVLGIVAGLLVGFTHNDIHLTTLQYWVAGNGIRWAVSGAFFRGWRDLCTAAVAHIALSSRAAALFLADSASGDWICGPSAQACERRRIFYCNTGRIRQRASGFIWRDVPRDGNCLMLRLL